jgi:molybdopterin converting factor small subunit
MLFENINQFELAKKSLLDNEGNINLALKELKESKEFNNTDSEKLIELLSQLNEKMSDTILNFIGSKIGGDISKLKTVLAQMRDQELKFNKEELEIYDEFYRIVQDQKSLDQDTKNPDYQNLSRELKESRASLNSRLRELTKTHNEIFDSLEKKVKDLIGDNKRKRKYFNAQRAIDVLETRNDRYDKIKSVTAKSAMRSKELEDFFGTNLDKVEAQVNVAQQNAAKQTKAATPKAPTKVSTSSDSPGSKFNQYDTDPERDLSNRLFAIKTLITKPNLSTTERKKIDRDLKSLSNDIDTAIKATAIPEVQKRLSKIEAECGYVYKKIY